MSVFDQKRMVLLEYSLTSHNSMDKEYNGVKIILISVYDLDNALVKELEESKFIVQFIEKPIEPANLIEIVARTIS